MNVNFDFNFWTMVIFLLNFGVMIFTAISNGSRVKNEDLKKILEALRADISRVDNNAKNGHGEHAVTIARLQANMDNAIDDNDLSAVHRRIDEILKKSSQMEGELNTIVKTLDRISQIMMSDRKHAG